MQFQAAYRLDAVEDTIGTWVSAQPDLSTQVASMQALDLTQAFERIGVRFGELESHQLAAVRHTKKLYTLLVVLSIIALLTLIVSAARWLV